MSQLAPTTQSLQQLTPQELRDASATFKLSGARSYDGLHLRHLGLLSDSALEVLAIIFQVSEMLGRFPRPSEAGRAVVASRSSEPQQPKESGRQRWLLSLQQALARFCDQFFDNVVML